MTAWLVDLLVLLGVIAIVAIAGWFVFSQIALPEPLRKILLVVLVIVAAIVAIAILLQLRGGLGKLTRSQIEPQYLPAMITWWCPSHSAGSYYCVGK